MNEYYFNDTINLKFQKHVLPNLKHYPYYKLKRFEIERVIEMVSKYFGIENRFKIKDKFEGDTFLKNNKMIYSTIMNLSKNNQIFFENSILTINDLKEKKLKINNKFYRIVNFSFGTLPYISLDPEFIKDGLIFSVNRDDISSYICGFISNKKLIELYGSKSSPSKYKNDKFEFENFNDLTSIETISLT